ncbi:MAG: hypothetical protein ACE5QW_00085 [Thermoplasmata archaeon]
MVESSVSKLRGHIRNVRSDIENKGIFVDEDINIALRRMLFAGRKAIEQGKELKDSKEYLQAAANVHKVVREKQRGSSGKEALPLISYKKFPKHRKKVRSLNLKMKKMKHISKGLRKLVHLANNRAKSEHEFEYFLREIEWLLR